MTDVTQGEASALMPENRAQEQQEPVGVGGRAHPEPKARHRAGRVELAVRADLRTMRDLKSSGRATLGELAVVLARAVDAQATGAPSTVAKLVQELRAVMVALRGGSDDGGDDPEFAANMSTPVRDT